jgi:hypothetical protein
MPARNFRRRRQNRNSSADTRNSANARVVTNSLSRNPRNNVVTRNMVSIVNYASSAGGVINYVASTNPSAYSGWADISAIYDEFRVLGGEAQLVSVLTPNSAAVNNMACLVYDNDDDTTVLTNSGEGMLYPYKKCFPATILSPSMIKMKFNCYPPGNSNSGIPWFTCATPTAFPHSVKSYCAALTASTTYWSAMIMIVVQFRSPIS